MGKNKTDSSTVRIALRSAISFSLVSGGVGLAYADEVGKLEPIEVHADRDYGYVVKSASAAMRTETPVENIPQSIVIVPRAMIEDQGAKTLSDVLRNVSNVNAVDARDANNVVFNIRGFHSGTVVDGVAMKGNFTDQESLVNVERIDVVKGPAGALFGSQGVGAYDTAGGTIAITTLEPAQEPVRKIGFKLGSYGEKGIDFDLNQPLDSAWAFRVTGESSNSDSETDRVFFRKRALFPSLAWSPNGDTRVVLRVRYLDNTTLDYSGLPVNGTLNTSTYTLPRQTNIAAGGLPDTTNKSRGANLQWTQKLSDTWNFSLLTAYNEVELNQRGTWLSDSASASGCFDFGSATPTSNTMCGVRMWARLKTTTISPSLTAKFETAAARHTLNVGIDYEETRDDEFMAYSNGTGALSAANVDLTNPAYPAWSEPVAPATPDQRNRYVSTVAYLQDQVDVGRWHFLGSIRYSEIKVTDINSAYGISNITRNSRTSPRIGAVYELTSTVSAFAGYGEGMRVPAFYLFAAPPKPEEYTQKEVGLRLKDLAGITATVALFDLNRKNVAISDPANAGYYIQAGRQRSKGIDIDLRWQATPSWSWIAAFTRQTARIVEDGDSSLINKQLFNVPERTARLATRYDIRSGSLAGLGLGLGLTYNSRLPGNSTNTFFTPATTVWDAQASYTVGRARYGLNVFNLTNKQYYVPSSYFLGGQVIPALPRTITATANFSF